MDDQVSGTEEGDERAQGGAGEAEAKVAEVFEAVAMTARVESVFGKPYAVEGSTVIPVAEVVNGLGFGIGHGTGPSRAEGGGGAGGGGGARSRPVALVIMDGQGVRVQPILDVNRLALAGLATAGFTVLWLLRLLRAGQGAGKDPAKGLPSAKTFRSLNTIL